MLISPPLILATSFCGCQPKETTPFPDTRTHTTFQTRLFLLTSTLLALLDAFWGALDQTEPCVPRPRAVPREPNRRVHHPLTPVQTWRRMGVSCFCRVF
jgi:hypothetical protein